MSNVVSDVWDFVWAVLTHWQAYMTGGIIMAALFIYERFWNKTISTRIVVVGIIGFLLVAFFMTWRDQYRRVVSLNNHKAHPEFGLESAQIVTVEGTKPETNEHFARKHIEIGLRSSKEHPATNITGHVLVINDDTGELVDRRDINRANNVVQNEPLYFYTNFLTFPVEGSPLLVFCDLKYSDASISGEEFHQGWYFETSNFNKGWFLNSLFDAGPEKREKIKTYLAKYGIEPP